MKVFVCVRNERGLQWISAFDEHESAEIEAAGVLARGLGYEVEELIGADLREVVLANEAFFREARS